VKDQHTEHDTFADALTRALKPRVPWWLRLRIRIDQNTIEVRHRVLIRVSSGRSRFPRYDFETDTDNVLFTVQSDIWNACHRKWPVSHQKLGDFCEFEELPSPESRLADGLISLRFKDQDEVLELAEIRMGADRNTGFDVTG
jgi:hypothetical protein